MGPFSFSNHPKTQHFSGAVLLLPPSGGCWTRWQVGEGGAGSVGFFGGASFLTRGSVSPPCPPRKEVLHLELCVLIPPRTVQTWIAGKRRRTGSPTRSPIPGGPAPAVGDIFGVTGRRSRLSIACSSRLPSSSGFSEIPEYIFAASLSILGAFVCRPRLSGCWERGCVG